MERSMSDENLDRPLPTPESKRGIWTPTGLGPGPTSYERPVTREQQLEAQLKNAVTLCAWLQRENQELRDLLDWDARLIANNHLAAGVRLTAYAARREMERQRVKRRLDGSIPVGVSRIAAQAGESRTPVGKHLSTLAEMDALKRTEERVVRAPDTKGGGDIALGLQVSLAPGRLYAHPERWRPSEPKNWGGSRQRAAPPAHSDSEEPEDYASS
jgi:hypothetical protein